MQAQPQYTSGQQRPYLTHIRNHRREVGLAVVLCVKVACFLGRQSHSAALQYDKPRWKMRKLQAANGNAVRRAHSCSYFQKKKQHEGRAWLQKLTVKEDCASGWGVFVSSSAMLSCVKRGWRDIRRGKPGAVGTRRPSVATEWKVSSVFRRVLWQWWFGDNQGACVCRAWQRPWRGYNPAQPYARQAATAGTRETGWPTHKATQKDRVHRNSTDSGDGQQREFLLSATSDRCSVCFPVTRCL